MVTRLAIPVDDLKTQRYARCRAGSGYISTLRTDQWVSAGCPWSVLLSGWYQAWHPGLWYLANLKCWNTEAPLVAEVQSQVKHVQRSEQAFAVRCLRRLRWRLWCEVSLLNTWFRSLLSFFPLLANLAKCCVCQALLWFCAFLSQKRRSTAKR